VNVLHWRTKEQIFKISVFVKRIWGSYKVSCIENRQEPDWNYQIWLSNAKNKIYQLLVFYFTFTSTSFFARKERIQLCVYKRYNSLSLSLLYHSLYVESEANFILLHARTFSIPLPLPTSSFLFPFAPTWYSHCALCSLLKSAALSWGLFLFPSCRDFLHGRT
jgi:predicted CDP-diglyceride synthetase/phosphatidate cytidylyltransferase